MVKRILSKVSCAFFCLLLWGCSSNPPATSSTLPQGKVQVLSTTAMIGDLVGRIGSPFVESGVLISVELDPHSYELVKGDDEKFSAARVVFSNGLGLEHGASLRYWVEKHPFSVAVGDEIQRKRPELILVSEGERDPHVWMDISLWANAIDPIVEALSQTDPEHADVYKENGSSLLAEMLSAHEKIRATLAAIPSEKRFLVTSHDAFHYFTRSYLAEEGDEDWQQRCAAPEGLSPDGQLSVTDIQRIIDHLCLYQVGVVFPESNLSRDSLRKIVSSCREKGLDVKISNQVLYGDAMGPPGSGADSYLKMIEHNAAVLLRDWSALDG